MIADLGLVVTLYDIQSIQGGFIYPNDGAAYFKVAFRVVVFRPFVGEVIVGKLKSCSRWVGGNPREAQRTHACMGMRGFGG